MDSAIWTVDRRTADAENPWPGLLSFSEADEAFFRGRDGEAQALARLALRARLTVLFGLSGLGKSSLLQAGLFPRLRRENVLPVYVRLDYSAHSTDLVSQVHAAIGEQAAAAGVEAPAARAGETLWEYFHRRGADFWSPRNRPMLPLLAFDLFEDIYPLGRGHPGRGALIETLGDLAEGRPPAELKARLDDHPEEAESFAFGRHDYKLLLALREDFLPDLEGLRDRIAAVSLHRLRLRRMDGDAALAVVRQGGELVAADMAERIVRFVAKARTADVLLTELQVEPALLSVVCRELNNKRRESGDSKITAGLLEGSEEEILGGFYERAVANVRPQVRTFIEEELLVEGYRDSVALEKALSAPGVDRQAIDRLVDRRLVRIDQRDGVERLELTHDLLTGVVAASRDERRRREAAQKDARAREEAELREREARRQLRRSRLYSVVLAAAVLLSLGLASFAYRQGRIVKLSKQKLEMSFIQLDLLQVELQEAGDKATEAIAALEEVQKRSEAELKQQREVEAQLRALLRASDQERADVARKLERAEHARRAANEQAVQAQSEATEKVTAYSVARDAWSEAKEAYSASMSLAQQREMLMREINEGARRLGDLRGRIGELESEARSVEGSSLLRDRAEELHRKIRQLETERQELSGELDGKREKLAGIDEEVKKLQQQR